jgi:hypothetical protein
MSRTFHHKKGRTGDMPIRVRGIRKEAPDLKRIARALIAMAEQAQAEAEAEAQAQDPQSNESRKETGSPPDTAPDLEGDLKDGRP